MEEKAFKPATKPSKDYSNVEPLKQLPNYDDVGVSFRQYSKTLISSRDYILNRQTPRHISILIKNGAFGSTLSLRPNPEKTFYCTGIQFHWLLGGGIFSNQFHLADVDENGHADIRIYEFAFQTGEMNFFINLKDCPRKFSGKWLDLYTQGSFSSGDFLHVQLFGWEE